MKIPNLITLLLLTLAFVSCDDTKSNSETSEYICPMECEGDKTYPSNTNCPVCKMDLKLISNEKPKTEPSNTISETSIFNLTSEWNTEEGESIKLIDLQGKTVVMVMIYTTCKAACPRLVADMRGIEANISEKTDNDNIRYVLVSIDPETDTPERLKAFAIENQMDADHWTFLQGTTSSVREFANVLAVKYKEISPLDFSHSNIISVFNPEGELVHQQEGLGVNNKETVAQILKLLK